MSERGKGDVAASVVIALCASAFAGVSLWERRHGWSVEWPMSTLVVWASLGPFVFCLAAFVVAAREVRRSAARSVPWIATGVALALMAYGQMGAAASANPFYDDPGSVEVMPPSDHPTLFVVRSSRGVEVVDLARPSLAHLASADAFRDATVGWIDGAWWSRSRERVIVLVGPSPESEHAIWALATDGSFERLSAAEGACDTAECSYAWIDARSELARVSRARDDAQRLTVVITSRALDGTVLRTLTWDPPPSVDGPVTILPDGTGALFADRCGSEGDARCIYRASIDGTSRALVGEAESSVCAIWIASDGSRAAYTRVDDPANGACTHLGVVALDGEGAPHDIADFVPTDPSSDVGVSGVTFSPDATRMALLSDDEAGCAGSEGFTTCHDEITTLRVDGSERSHPTTQWYDEGWLVWVR